MDAGTVTLICGVIACIIGVLTFIVGISTRAKQEGAMLEKISQALTGIEEIKKRLEDSNKQAIKTATTVQVHEERINTLTKRSDGYEATIMAVGTAIVELLKQLLQRRDDNA